jgi:hypothetical protein
LTALAESTDAKAQEVFRSVEKIVNPTKLADPTAARLSYFQSKLREKGLADATIAGLLAYMRSALKWAVEMGLLPAVPTIQKPPRAKASKMMKGRPDHIGGVRAHVEQGRGHCRGCCYPKLAPITFGGYGPSGLRTAESLELY